MIRFPATLTATIFLIQTLACRSTGPASPVGDVDSEVSAETTDFPQGSIERIDPAVDALIPEGARIQMLARGFEWAEGPVWVSQGDYLLFSDIPRNTVYRWDAGRGITVYMRPSGYTGPDQDYPEPGSNGLTLDSEGRLVLCEHGDRRVAREGASGQKTTLADRFEGKRFNSPNDLCYRANDDLYFTDPPYGLKGGVDDPARELDFQGIYRLSKDDQLYLLNREMTRPNGIAFSPDERHLYVANSDPERAVWMRFGVQDDGSLDAGEVFFDATALVGKQLGLPDGLKVDRDGNLFATGPGGVLILSPEGRHLGTILTGQATANCAWGEDGTVLYITADSYLLRLQTSTKGAGW